MHAYSTAILIIFNDFLFGRVGSLFRSRHMVLTGDGKGGSAGFIYLFHLISLIYLIYTFL